ncbi:DUF4097 domain-containing protein [Marinococcus halophilus]|uniref:Uncharacterized protein n=1 Tax=Marinococcus halophilus TaxID=1371 RepID=A0A510Y6Q6_MARHA|nr:DUF4097 family beta strand repeat-containing protein [Marinococcus halophilus]GEK59034.1 hypothetical protein MHA01_19390 [Marinococcus halophilus]
MDEERQRILKMMEDGIISLEEGERLLRAKGSAPSPEAQEGGKEDGKGGSSESRRSGAYRTDKKAGGSQKRKSKEDPFAMLSGFFDHALDRVKRFDLDFNFGPSVDFQHTFEHDESEIRSLDTFIQNGSLICQRWEGSTIRVACQVKAYTEEDEDSARREFIEGTDFDSRSGKLRFASRSGNYKVQAVVYIPEKSLDKMDVSTFNGDIRIDGVQADNLYVKASNGAITVLHASAGYLAVETANGTVELKEGRIGSADVKTWNGSIHYDGSLTDIEAEALNGAITARYTSVSERSRALLSTTTGSIKVIAPREIRTEGVLRTNVGNYKCLLDNIEVKEEKSEFMQKYYQFVSNSESAPTLRLEASAKTGTITVQDHE